MNTTKSITCPKCNKESYNLGDVVNKFCIDCGFHSNFTRTTDRSGGLSDVLSFIKNEEGLKEPLMINFAGFSEERIKLQLAPFWFPHVTANPNLTPLENAKKWYMDLNLIPMDNCNVNELIQFCYDDDEAQTPLFAVAQNGGLVVLYQYDVVWFKEPSGAEYWARMS